MSKVIIWLLKAITSANKAERNDSGDKMAVKHKVGNQSENIRPGWLFIPV